MADYYLDTSALLKFYVQETGSGWVRGLFDPSLQHRFVAATITAVEALAAITRRARSGTMTAVDAASACAAFRADLLTAYRLVEVTGDVLARAMGIAETHALRGYDAVQLAAALETNELLLSIGLPPITFVSADNDLNTVAAAEGLAVENPNAHP